MICSRRFVIAAQTRERIASNYRQNERDAGKSEEDVEIKTQILHFFLEIAIGKSIYANSNELPGVLF